MTEREWAWEQANMIEGLIVITNGEQYKAVVLMVYEVGGYKENGWVIDNK